MSKNLTETETETETNIDRDRDSDSDSDRERQKQRQRDRDKETDTETETETLVEPWLCSLKNQPRLPLARGTTMMRAPLHRTLRRVAVSDEKTGFASRRCGVWASEWPE